MKIIKNVMPICIMKAKYVYFVAFLIIVALTYFFTEFVYTTAKIQKLLKGGAEKPVAAKSPITSDMLDLSVDPYEGVIGKSIDFLRTFPLTR